MNGLVFRLMVALLAIAACPAVATTGGAGAESTTGSASTDASEEGPVTTITGPCTSNDDCPACQQVAGSTCGNGVIEAFEECDGGSSCSDCRRTDPPSLWLRVLGLGGLVPLADGSAIAVRMLNGNPLASVVRYAPDGSVAWSTPFELPGGQLAVDPTGNSYVVGFTELSFDATPWIGSWDPSGEPRWLVEGTETGWFLSVAADAERVVTGGVAELGTAGYHAILVQYGADGVEAWRLEDPALSGIKDIALVGPEIAATAWGVESDDAAKLLRFDGTGTGRWSIDLLGDGEDVGFHTLGVIADGSGGTWSFGEVDGGPWAARHDGEGNQLDRIDCLGHATGWIERAAVGPGGELALAMRAHVDPASADTTAAWFAVVTNGEISRAFSFPDDQALFSFALGWRPDGTLVLGWSEGYDNATYDHVLVVDP